MADEIEPEGESDMRRRAAWLLGMLAIVAVLLVVVMTLVLGTEGGGKPVSQSGSLDGSITSPSTPSSSPHPTPSTSKTSTHATPSSPSDPASAAKLGRPGSCPTATTCILDGDVGGGVAAINAYRTHHGLPAITGGVSNKAQTCAMNNGNGCSGGWAETQLGKPDGATAVTKILPFGRLLDPKIKVIDVGWAYDPGAKQYYFAIIRKY